MSIAALKPKQKDIPVENLFENPDNPRFHKDQSVFGIKVKDTTNIDTMAMVIRDTGGVPERLAVEEMPDGRFKVLRGNRRLLAARKLIADPTTPQELVKNLHKLPCDVFVDLTDKQRNDIVNDQRSQKFMRSEIVAYIFRLQRAGWTFSEIAMHVYTQMGQYTAGGARKLAEVERATNDADRKKIILSWLKGTLDMIILNCGKLGPRVQKALLLTEMQNDGILPETGTTADGKPTYETPEFKPTQGRCLELIKAKEADTGWTAENGGPTFNALIEKFSAQDNGAANAENVVRPTTKQLEEQFSSRTRSKAAKAAIDFARGLKPAHYADVDDEAYRLERLTDVAVKYRDGLKNDAAREVVNAFLTADPLSFEQLLIKFS